MAPFAFTSIVVASNDDPYATMTFSRAVATSRGSELVELWSTGTGNAERGVGRVGGRVGARHAGSATLPTSST
jgi:predicted alpha/beta hydrolase family esterase